MFRLLFKRLYLELYVKQKLFTEDIFVCVVISGQIQFANIITKMWRRFYICKNNFDLVINR